jgi:hypothetical protein
MSKAHQTEASRVGGALLDRRRGGHAGVVVAARGGPPHVGRGRAGAIFARGHAVGLEMLGRLVGGPVSSAKEAGGIEGAAALEVSFAAVRSEAPQRHCARGLASHLRRYGSYGAVHGTVRVRNGEGAGQDGVGRAPVRLRSQGAVGCARWWDTGSGGGWARARAHTTGARRAWAGARWRREGVRRAEDGGQLGRGRGIGSVHTYIHARCTQSRAGRVRLDGAGS